jgi:glycosyltransferase involved in cell wall biosynthesis
MSKVIKRAYKKNAVVKGYVERFENCGLHGWVIHHDQQPLQLLLSINGEKYPINKPEWVARPDVAEKFGYEFLQSGFNVVIPGILMERFAMACKKNKRIDIIANGIKLRNTLQSSTFIPAATEPAASYHPLAVYNATGKNSPPTGSYIERLRAVLRHRLRLPVATTIDSPSVLMPHKKLPLKKNNTHNALQGCVERFDNLCLYGWIINHNKQPIQLALRVDGELYPVTFEWTTRSDIAENLGADFLQSGFKITLPRLLIDPILNTLAQNSSIDVVANDFMLPNAAVAISPMVEHNALGAELASQPQKFKTLCALNAEWGVEVSVEDFGKLLSGHITYPLRISRHDMANANYYVDRAKQKLLLDDIGPARTLLKISLVFAKKTEALELLGNTYFEQKDYETAACHYEEATISLGNASKWLFANLAHCKKHAAHPRSVIEALLRGIDKNPEAQHLREPFDELIYGYYIKQQGAFEVCAVTDNRAALVDKVNETTAFIYQAYLRFYGVAENPRWVGSCNANRVLIVGDFHIPQCVRYRIDQKIEQLEAAGKAVKAISWTDLAGQQNVLAFYDVVIFYRVPAEPPVLKAIAQVNATGRLSLYEIDDLLFATDYPPPLETYGGYLDLNTHIQLMKGMASFNAAARHCRLGIASTRPLAERLQALVFGQHCFVHRNGVDALNVFKAKHHDAAKENLDIFYGSGTMAHNSDFTDLILPAMARLFAEYPHIGLKIVGYLKLPDAFLAEYPERVKQMPPVKSIKAYWSMLERADINLAVLHDDVINGCKSELKWFEAACLGIPSVVSSTANYRDVISDGEDALLAATTEEWYQHLKALIDDAPLRQRMADAARAKVESDYSVEALAASLTGLLANALAVAQNPAQPKRKKIALVNVFFPPQSIGGATRVVADNFDLLQRDYADQFEISVFTSDAESQQPYQMTLYNHQGARVYRSTILWREHMDWHPSDEKMGALFSEYLAAEQPDLVHFHCIQRLTASIVDATVAAQIPYIVTVHDAWWISDYQFLVDANHVVYPDGHPDPYSPCTPPKNISAVESIERVLYLKALLNNADASLTVSNCFAEIYRKNEIPRIRVNKNGISESLTWQAKDTHYTDKVVCGHVGGMAEHKGYFLLKEAIEALQPEHLEMLVVDHSQEEDYRLQTQWGGVPVTFVGRMNQSRVVELYQQLDVLFAPSTWPESYGLVTREAAACGCWIVASSMGGIGEDVIEGTSGFIVEPTLEALSGCIKKIDNNHLIYKGAPEGHAIRSVAEQVRELVDIYLA